MKTERNKMPREQKTIIVSPVATAAYAWLANPDEGQDFSDGKYKVTLLLDKDDKETKTFIKKLKTHCDTAAEVKWGKVKTLRYPFKDGDEKDKEDFVGKHMLLAKTKYRPGMCDSKNGSLSEGNEPRSGDLIRASFELYAYDAAGQKGVSCQLRNVQLVEKRNVGAQGNDFDSLDDGYVELKEDAVEDDSDF